MTSLVDTAAIRELLEAYVGYTGEWESDDVDRVLDALPALLDEVERRRADEHMADTLEARIDILERSLERLTMIESVDADLKAHCATALRRSRALLSKVEE